MVVRCGCVLPPGFRFLIDSSIQVNNDIYARNDDFSGDEDDY